MGALFKNAKLIMPTGAYKGEVLTEGDIISDISLGSHIETPTDRTTDVEGKYSSPGFIETYSHGAGGYDFMDGDVELICGACRTHPKRGTTTILPTTITSMKESLLSFVDLFNTLDLQKPGCPNIYGLHLEGPYFAMSQKGAQEPKYSRNLEPEEYSAVPARIDRIKRWPFAIEPPDSGPFLTALREQGIVSSLAHSDATCQEVFRTYENGITALTHLYSCMASVKRVNAFRVAGVIKAGYLLGGLYMEVIADGCHLPKEFLQLIYKAKGAGRIYLVTDSMRVVGTSDGEHILGSKGIGITRVKEDGVAKLPNRSAFASGVAISGRLVRTFRELTGASLYEVVKMASATPAHMLGIQAKTGSIGMGKAIDLIVSDEDIQVPAVMMRGEFVTS